MSQRFYETEAYRRHPEGCKCPSTNGGGDCDWCHVYYGKDSVELSSHPSTMTVHDLALIRAAILMVIDDGKWRFYADESWTEPLAINQRLDFTDAICKYIVDREGE